MAMQQLTLPGEIVKKHNDLVRSKINISSKTASRALACLIACIRHDDTQFKGSYTVPLKDFLPLDDSGNPYRQAVIACRELAKATAEKEWPDPDDPDGNPIFEAMPFFMSVKYRKGTVKAQFNPKMSGMLLDLRKFFTEINLIEYLTLPSLYSQRLFEILKSWSGLPEVILSVEELNRILDTPESLQNDFAQFRRRVLEKAHKDIQEKTSLRFEWQPIKAGRSVVKILFSFGPSRKVIAEAETKKAKEAKQSRLNNQRFIVAAECLKNKSGQCTVQDNKPIICKLCREHLQK